MTSSSPIRRHATKAVVIAATAATVAACGSSSSPTSIGTTNGTGSNVAFPMSSVTGKIASVGSAGVSVTTSTGKRNVAFGTTTQFSKVTDTTRSQVKVGACVSATSKAGGFGATAITATTLTISSTKACAARTITTGGPGTGSAPGGTPPSGAPQGGPIGGSYGAPDNSGPGTTSGGTGQPPQGARRPGFGGAIGTVTSITGHTVVVKAPTGATTTITTTSATTYSSRTTVTRSQATTGQCIAAFGRRAGTTVDAVSVTLASPVNGRCTAIAAGPGGFGAGPMLSSNGPANG